MEGEGLDDEVEVINDKHTNSPEVDNLNKCFFVILPTNLNDV